MDYDEYDTIRRVCPHRNPGSVPTGICPHRNQHRNQEEGEVITLLQFMESMFELGFLDVSDMRWKTPPKTFRKSALHILKCSPSSTP